MLGSDKSARANVAASACVLSMAVEVTMVCSVAPFFAVMGADEFQAASAPRENHCRNAQSES